jgi:cytoskeletal protein CcmA (bactofilin family)
MREERGAMAGDVVVYEDFTLWGSVGGNVRVIEGGKFWIRGSVYGNVSVEAGGRCHVLGSIKGNLTVAEDAKAIVTGAVGGEAVNLGGRLYIEATAKILGGVKTKSGETRNTLAKN